MRMTLCAALLLVLTGAAPLAAQTFTWQDISGVPGFFTLLKPEPGTLLGAVQGFPAENARIYLSGDAGRSWNTLGLTNGVLVELAARGPRIAAGRFVNISSPNSTAYQIYYSTDRGVSWLRVLQSGFVASVVALMVSDSGALYGVVATGPGKGLLAKWRGSSQWSTFGTPAFQSFFNVTVAAVAGTRTFLVGTDAYGLSYSLDSGTTWSQALSARRVTAINVELPGKFYVGTAPTASITGGVFYSPNEGQLWQFLGLSDRIVTSIAVDAAGRVLASTDAGIFAYTGHDLDWVPTGPLPEAIDRVVTSDGETIVATSESRGLYRSENNGATWELNALRGQDISAVVSGPGSALVLGTYGNGTFVSADNGVSWTQTPGDSICDYVFSLARSGDDVYACTDCGLFRTNDTGRSWRNISSASISGGIYSAAVRPDGAIYAAANFGVYRSDDGGATWLPTSLGSYPVVSVASGPAGDLLAATVTQGVFRSLDGGFTWNDVGVGRNDVQTATINWEGHYFVGVNGGIIESEDQGATWVWRELPDARVYALAFGGEYVIAGTSAGVYVSYDRGVTWQQRNAGLLQPTVLSVAVGSAGNLLAGTYHGGIYRTVEAITGAEPGAPELPVSTRLLQNYPNPFNPSTAIRYTVASAGEVTLKIYDFLGREVATLARGPHQAGEYEATWNAAGFPSGVYLARLSAGKEHETRKLLLMK